MLDKDHLSEPIISAMQKADVPGLAISIIENNKIVYDQVFGVKNTKNRLPLQKNTLFQAASLSKPVFAYLVLKLCERGEIDLDAPLSRYWSASYSPDRRSLAITTRQVLAHSTGFPNWRSDTKLELETVPGGRFGYSGEGYEYLQKVVEHLTGQALHDYAQVNLFEPLEMKDTTFIWGLDEVGEFLLDDENNVLPPRDAIFSSAAFSLLTVSSDYARFLMAMLNPEENHPFKLNQASANAMLTPQIPVGRHRLLSWGLGWGIQHTEIGDGFWHWGGVQNNYFSYCFALKQERSGVVILTNDESGLDICEVVAQVALNN